MQGLPQDSRNLRAERSLSDFHRAHSFTSSFNYELPFGSRKPYLQKGVGAQLFGGFR